jgi:hypothetical protein
MACSMVATFLTVLQLARMATSNNILKKFIRFFLLRI